MIDAPATKQAVTTKAVACVRAALLGSCVAVGVALAAPAAGASDTRAALVPGGPHPYFAAWADAARAAAAEFGVQAEYRVPAQWELSQQNRMIESLVGQGFNAFLVFPGDATGTNSTLGELASFGIPSAALAGCTQAPTPALFCLGTDVYRSAYLGTKELIEALGGSGRIAHFTGFLVDPNTRLRIDAVQRAADEVEGVEVIQVIADIDAPEPADERINAFLAAQGANVDGIVTTAWVPAVVAATSLRNLGDRRIKMVGIDHDEVVLRAIADGYVHGTMLQNPYGQGFIGVYALDLIRQGCTLRDDAPWQTTAQTDRFIDSGTAFVGADQVATFQDAMVRVTEEIMATFKDRFLDCPS